MAARTGNSRVGPMPAPTKLKLLRGEVKKDRLNMEEPVVAPGLPEKPSDMLEGADAVWDHIMAVLGPSGAITLADGEPVRHYAEAVVTYRSLIATYKVTGEKPVIRGRGGDVITNPILSAIDRARTAAQVAGREIGASPSSRGLIRVKAAPTADPFEQFLTRKPATRRAIGG